MASDVKICAQEGVSRGNSQPQSLLLLKLQLPPTNYHIEPVSRKTLTRLAKCEPGASIDLCSAHMTRECVQ